MQIDIGIVLAVFNMLLLLLLVYMHFKANSFGFGSARVEWLTERNTSAQLELIRIVRHIYEKFYNEKIPPPLPGELTDALDAYEQERPDRPPYK